jgi:hypothetical protein
MEHLINEKTDKYVDFILGFEWKNLIGNRKKLVFDFIKQCKYVYGLNNLLVIRKKLEKVNTATQAINCNDKIQGVDCFCQGCIIIENGINVNYRCCYSYYSDI